MKLLPLLKRLTKRTAFTVAVFVVTGFTMLIARPGIKYTVSIEKPASHVFAVTLTYDDISGPYIELKMAVWTPGYYWIENYPKNVNNFDVKDENGKKLQWEKTSKNVWRVYCAGVKSISAYYEVFAASHSVAEPFVDDSHAFITPAGLIIYPDGRLNESTEITFNFPENWSTVSTGLVPVKDKLNTYRADNFDHLFDSPILIGNQGVISFVVDEVPHHIASLVSETVDQEKVIDAYSKVVESAVSLIGEMPYEDYTFIIMGPGGGGLEHLNSMAVFTGFRGGTILPQEREPFLGWMSFIAHEYFHLYNIKTIRPFVLGPFDYDKENYTNMLWVSEGFTVYYENIILNRAGFMNRDEMLTSLKNTILTYESVPGHKVQPVTLSSYDTWIHSFMREPDAINTSISYYDKGCGLGLLLDLKIRNETNNEKSLNDVMRYLYFKYYKDLKRGFTDDEFRQICEKYAGSDLSEIFTYASTTQDIDYSRYFAYAGLTVEDKYKELPGSYTGIRYRKFKEGVSVSVVETGSPAWEAGIASSDEIVTLNGTKVTCESLDSIMQVTVPGSTQEYKVMRSGIERTIKVVTAKNLRRSFDIGYISNPSPLQTSILNDLFRL